MTKIKTVEDRWEEGIPHHPKSIEVAHELRRIDKKYGNDCMDLRFGGDGDNGEDLLYLLDIYFEQEGKG